MVKNKKKKYKKIVRSSLQMEKNEKPMNWLAIKARQAWLSLPLTIYPVRHFLHMLVVMQLSEQRRCCNGFSKNYYISSYSTSKIKLKFILDANEQRV